MADYFEYAVIVSKEAEARKVTIDYFDEYLLKDTSREDVTITQYFPDRIVTKERDYNNPRIKTYYLSREEADQLKTHPDLRDVERAEIARHLTSSIQTEYFPTNVFSGTTLTLYFNGFDLYETITGNVSTSSFTPGDGEFAYTLDQTQLPLTASVTSLIISTIDSVGNNLEYYLKDLDPGSTVERFNVKQLSGDYPTIVTESFRFTVNGPVEKFNDSSYILPVTTKHITSSDWICTGENEVKNWSVNLEEDYYVGALGGEGFYKEGTAPVNWGLKYHTKYEDKVDWEDLWLYNGVNEFYLSGSDAQSQYNYTLDGTGVDIVIVDAGVYGAASHPEFKDKNGSTRVKYYDWYQHIPGKTMPNGFYNFIYYESTHGVRVAGVAAGRICGWAKNANIYDFRIFGNDGGYITDGLEAIRHFHISKSIDPVLGYKRPTVVNFSVGSYIFPFGSDPGIADIPPYNPSYIDQLYFKGTSIGLTGNENTPGPEYLFRYHNSASFNEAGTGYYTFLQYESSYIVALLEQLTESGVIFVKAAGNYSAIMAKESDEDNGIRDNYITQTVPLYDPILPNGPYSDPPIPSSYIIFDAGTPLYYNRCDSGAEDIVIVGALSYETTVPGTASSDELSPYYGIIPYDIYGNRGNINNLTNIYYHAYFPFLNPENLPYLPESPDSYPPKRGSGNSSIFPGWDYLNQNGQSTAAFFTNVGPALDTFAAGQQIITATYNFPYASDSLKISYSLYDPTYEDFPITYYMTRTSGTSFASPQVAGMAALYLQMNPQATPKQFKQFIKEHNTLKVFTEDPFNRPDYTGSIHQNNIRNESGWGYNAGVGHGYRALNGSPTGAIHWPYNLANPLTMT